MALWYFVNRVSGRQALRFTCLLLLLLLVASLTFVWRVKSSLNQILSVVPDRYIELRSGENYWDLLHKLNANGWLDTTWQARIYAKLGGRAGYLQAGEYLVSGRSLLSLLQAMRQGEVRQHYFQLLPGWRWSDIHQALLNEPNLDYRLKDVQVLALPTRLGMSLPFLEGAFFPDSYAYTKDSQAADVLRTAHFRMMAVLDEIWLQRAANLPINDPHEALILASIIEKETGLDQDRSMISAVLVNRLRLDMKLEVDPTVIFGLGQQFDGNLTSVHLGTPGPYNTYANKGLPPTPIALPGQGSLIAALQPADSPALFFVSRGDGSSEFSQTRSAHEKAVRKYQLKHVPHQQK